MGKPITMSIITPDCPIWNLEEREDLRRDLHQQPCDDSDFVNVAPLQLCEERGPAVHGFVTAAGGTCTFNFWQSAAKRGSSL